MPSSRPRFVADRGRLRYAFTIPRLRHPFRAAFVALAGAAIVATVAVSRAVHSWRPIVVARARLAADDPRLLPSRLTPLPDGVFADVARVLPRPVRPSQRLALANELMHLRGGSADEAARAAAMAEILSGRCGAAADAFGRVVRRTPGDWNDLAAAELCAAERERDPERWLSALTATDRARSADPQSAAAAFNWAVVTTAMDVGPVARKAWSRALTLDAGSSWSGYARRRQAAVLPGEAEQWRARAAEIGRLPPAELAQLAARFPQQARRSADALYLTAWATAIRDGQREEAARQLAIATAIARTIAPREPFLTDAVAAIGRVEHDPLRLHRIVEAQLAYGAGRIALRRTEATQAEPALRRAAILFAVDDSPMAQLARFWVASALTEQNRVEEATAILTQLLDAQAAAGNRYPSIVGHAAYQLSLVEAMRGNWSASFAAAQRAKESFELLGETGNLADVDAVLSEDYDLLGQPLLARRYAFAAIRGAARAGAYDRASLGLASLCRTELRAGDWERARALARLEQELAPAAPDVRLVPDRFLRLSTAEWHRGDHAAATRALQGARVAAQAIPDRATRSKIVADVDAVEGTFARTTEPRRAVALLASAVAFQRRTARPILLPELELELGRASLAVNDLPRAGEAFDAGLAELERQRSRVADAELRPGIFDNARELFDEALALQLRRGGDAETVFSYAERGRARAVLEQITARGEPYVAPRRGAISAVQHALAPDAALVEYVSLPARLLLFVVRRDGCAIRSIAVPRKKLEAAVEAFRHRRGVDGAELYEMLITPVLADLAGATSLELVVNGALELIPFAALFDRGTGRFLVEQYTIGTSPSAGVFLATVERSRRMKATPPVTALVLADPAVPADEYGDLPSLEGAESEARRVARDYPRAEVLTREAATSDRFLTQAVASDIVHFAGHALTNEREPSASALVCARGARRPGGITAGTIARMHFSSTRVVVLAACSTMTGHNAAVEGVPSLSRAFLVAGVPAVIGTLWDIRDTEAAAIVRPLHAQLARNVTPSVALRNAQRAAIAARLPPAQWSAFALIGSAQAPRQNPNATGRGH